MNIKNSRIVGNIYETVDYSIFKRLPSNRDVLQARLKKLIESFSIREIMNPIVVTKNYEIIDGQGRFEAKKILNRPIQYIIDESATIEDCRRLNAYNTPWTINDYVKSLADGGNDNCQRLLECSEELGISIARCLRLSNHTGGGHADHRNALSITAALDKLKFTADDAEIVKSVWKKIGEIKEALAFTSRINEAFCSAVKVMTQDERYDHDGMLSKCKKSKNTFYQASGLEGMLKEFSRIYNSGRTADKRLYFEDYMRNRGYNSRDYDFSKNDKTDMSTLSRRKK